MVLAKSAQPEQIVLTDYAPPVLQNLLQNLVINGYREESFEEKPFKGPHDFSYTMLRESKGNMGGNSMSLKLLEWFGCVENNALPPDFPSYDIIIAADIVYAPELAAVVPKMLSLLFRHNPASFAIIATTVRNDATFQVFVSTLESCNLTRDDVLAETPVPTSSIVYERSNVVLHRIRPRDGAQRPDTTS